MVKDWDKRIKKGEEGEKGKGKRRRRKGNKTFASNFHWGEQSKKKDKVKKHRVKKVDKGLHLYAVEWTDKYFKIYYANLLVRVFTNPDALKHFNQTMHIIISNGIDMENGVEKASYPYYHEIDYVRAYKRK